MRRHVLACTSLVLVAALAATGCSHKKKTARAAQPSVSASPSPSPSETPPPPPLCPLTNAPAPGGAIPQRLIFAVKMPNDPTARPHIGLDAADIVYEEPVEGGITRFIAMYQCRDAERIEPVRSARFVDIDVLAQYGKAIFGHAGGIDPVMQALRRANLIEANYSGTPYQSAYHRDPSRAAPNNLFTSTAEIYKIAGPGTPPAPVFTFLATATATAPAPSPAPGVSSTVTSTVTSTAVPGAAPGSVVHVPFSGPDYDVYWKWDAASGNYARNIGSTPTKLANDTPVSTRNVVVQLVSVVPSQYVEDAGGGHQNLVGTTGSGPALVCRLGSCVTGTWSRPDLGAVTKYLDPAANQIPLAPGATWVELEPNSQKPSTS